LAICNDEFIAAAGMILAAKISCGRRTPDRLGLLQKRRRTEMKP